MPVRGIPYRAENGRVLVPLPCSVVIGWRMPRKSILVKTLQWILKVLQLEAVSYLHSLQLTGKFFLEGRACHRGLPGSATRVEGGERIFENLTLASWNLRAPVNIGNDSDFSPRECCPWNKITYDSRVRREGRSGGACSRTGRHGEDRRVSQATSRRLQMKLDSSCCEVILLSAGNLLR